VSQRTADEFDISLRAAAMAFLDRLCVQGNASVRSESLLSFEFAGRGIRLMAPQQGIWKPRQLQAALSIRTVYSQRPEDRPYEDAIGADGRLRYKWRGTDPDQADNRALRRAMELQRPLIWFWGVAPAMYLPIYPVFLQGEEVSSHQFVVSLDEDELELPDLALLPLQRRYAERIVLQRLHQPLFRERVLLAYEDRCALCRLRHRELLDAAHILGDAEGGEPVVPNGIAMCKIHHAAFDNQLFGVRPDYRVHVSATVLAEHDGPTLRHALQEIHGTRLELPRSRGSRPDPDRLEERYERFLAAS
jgi:putative restriction endonuclease